MPTYQQETKDKSRQLIWEQAVENLTTSRENSRILEKTYIKNLWDYAFNDCILKYGFAETTNNKTLYDWLSFSDITYSQKNANQLKVAFFCGPEPENDVKHLITLGVRIENIYAFEYDKALFHTAINSLRSTYPTLKIYNGKIEDFTKTNTTIFDIIYLDFTQSLLNINTMKCFSQIIDSNCLAELGIVAINTCYPDKTDENISFLADFFYFQPCIDYPVLREEDDGGDNEGRFFESCSCHGYSYLNVKTLIDKNFEEAYSAFQTRITINYTNHIKPFSAVLNNPIILKRIFNTNALEEVISNFSSNEDILFDPEWFSLYHFNSIVKDQKWKDFFDKKEKGKQYTITDAIIILYSYLDSAYSTQSIKALSENLYNQLAHIMRNVIGGKDGLFCDVPMIHLWLELAINQLGYPYHQNTKNHKRYSYTAQTRKMCLDIFTFDKCRALYDWLPMIEYYGEDLSVLERQMMTRICLDTIGKHNLHILQRLYMGSALIGINERSWSNNFYFQDRIQL